MPTAILNAIFPYLCSIEEDYSFNTSCDLFVEDLY